MTDEHSYPMIDQIILCARRAFERVWWGRKSLGRILPCFVFAFHH